MPEYDLSNKPTIPDCTPPHAVQLADLYDDIGDAVHAKSPTTGEEWRFYYERVGKRKVLDRDGIIQL